MRDVGGLGIVSVQQPEWDVGDGGDIDGTISVDVLGDPMDEGIPSWLGLLLIAGILALTLGGEDGKR